MNDTDVGNSIQIINQLDMSIVIYNTTTTTEIVDPPSTNHEDYYPIYSNIATIPANTNQTVNISETLARLVICRVDNDFPICVYVPPIIGGGSVTISEASLTACQTALTFYQNYVSQPYAPISLQFSELLLNNTNLITLNDQVSTFLSQNGYTGSDYTNFSTVSYWIANSLFACSGTYYCYEPQNDNSGFVLPTVSVGQINIDNGTASYVPADGSSVIPLTLSKSILSSTGANDKNGIHLTGILRSLSWEGKPSVISMCFSGKKDGNDFIAQTYENPTIPWWVAAYDMAYATFLGVQVMMTADMAVHVLSGIKNALQYFVGKANYFISSIRSKFEGIGNEADPVASMGDSADPINVDIDTDTDIDIDTDTDTDTDIDTVTDTVTDIDTDVDVDVDDDVFAVIDVDVDTDIDIDIDTDIDTDNVVDTVDVVDTDTDIDIDTDINVQPGNITMLLKKVGSWIMTKGFPALVSNLTIMAAFEGAQKILNVWKDASEKELNSLSPQQTTGVGLIINYMLNENNSIATRWNTIADYVQQGSPDASSQQILIASILMTSNTVADNALSAWRWSTSDEDAAVSAMSQYKVPEQQYLAYQSLANYTYNGKELPVKVGCNVVMKYTAKLTSTDENIKENEMLNINLEKQSEPRRQSEIAWRELVKSIAATVNDISEEPNKQHLPSNCIGDLTIIGSGIESVGFAIGDEELIKAADAVFYCVADPATIVWIKDIRPDAYDLYVLYNDSKPRYTTYMQMSEAMLYYVRQGKKVVAIYYGHPGVFVLSTHRSIMIAKREGHNAVMKAGVCAFDCLCADLGVDPCHPGMQTHEATDMLIRGRKPDTSLHVVLWQVGLIGEMGYRRKGYINNNLSVLISYLQSYYGESYPVVHYVASRYPTIPPLIETYPLNRLHEPEIQLRVTGISTFYLAPRDAKEANKAMLERLGLLKPGQTIKASSSPLREIGQYGPREIKAIKELKSFEVQQDYHYQENNGASRFIIQLRKDLELQQLYKFDPDKAVSSDVFPGLTSREQFLLATRDSGAIQIAAKGIAKYSKENQKFVLELLTNRLLTSSLLQFIHSQKTIRDEELVQWVEQKGHTIECETMRNDINLIQRDYLLPWTGVYFSNKSDQLFTLIGSLYGTKKSSLFVNGTKIKHFSFVKGVLKWKENDDNPNNGFLRFDVNPMGRRRIIGSTWTNSEAKPMDGAFTAYELNINRNHPSQRIGLYKQIENGVEHVLEISVKHSAQSGRHILATLDNKILDGVIKLSGQILTIGNDKFKLTELKQDNDSCWHAQPLALQLFNGTFNVYMVHSGKDQVVNININNIDVLINNHVITPICSSPSLLSWTDGPTNAFAGQVRLIINPITLLPMLFGMIQTEDGVSQQCYGLVSLDANTKIERPEPEFKLPLVAWESLVSLCSDPSYSGSQLLWYKWEKTQYTAKIMNTVLQRLFS